MRLHPPWLIVKNSLEENLLLHPKAPGDDFGNLVPLRKVLVVGTVAWGFDAFDSRYEGIQFDDFFVRVEQLHGELARYIGG